MLHRRLGASLLRLALFVLAFSLLTNIALLYGQDRLLRRAVAATRGGDYTEALALYRQLEQSSNPWYAWAGTSGQVVIHRMTGNGDSARAVTERIAATEAKLAGLMALWDGDTARVEGDFGRAVAAYRLAADRYGHQLVFVADFKGEEQRRQGDRSANDALVATAVTLSFSESSQRPVRESDFTQPFILDLAFSMSLAEKKSSGLTLSMG